MHRLEARAALKNGRGNGALRKLGAVQECVGDARQGFVERDRGADFMRQAQAQRFRGRQVKGTAGAG